MDSNTSTDQPAYSSPLPFPGNLSALLDRAASLHPDRAAIGFPPELYTCAQFHDRVCRMAGALRRLGVRRGERVLLSARNSYHYACASLAALRIGAIVVPTNPMIRHYELAHIVAETQPRLVLCEAWHLLWVVHAFQESGTAMPPIVTLDLREECAAFVEDLDFTVPCPVAEPMHPDETALIVYTAAMDGYAMGAMLTHASLFHNAVCCAVGCFGGLDAPAERVASVLPMFHLHGFTSGFLVPLAAGVAAFPLNPFHDLREAVAVLEQHEVTQMASVPAVYHAMARLLAAKPAVCARIRNFTTGGIATPAEVFEEYREQLGITLREGYGLTECSPVVTWCDYAHPVQPGTVGRAVACCQLRIADAHGDPLPAGSEGAICVRGPSVGSGYYQRPDCTARVFRDGWFRTGDLGRLDADGCLTITGLEKEMINVFGLKVYPREVERIIGRHPDIAGVRVFADRHRKEGALVACAVALQPGRSLHEGEFRRWCRHNLSAYKIPRSVHVCDDPNAARGPELST